MKPAHGIALNSSIILFGQSETAHCAEPIARAVALGNFSLIFIPTFLVEREANSDNVRRYCIRDEQGGCPALTQAQLDTYSAALAHCFAQAFAQGIEVSVMPHLDDLTGAGYWRNNLLFDPREELGGFSYESFVLRPIARALRQSAPPSAHYGLALAGEMGSSVFAFASAYLEILQEFRSADANTAHRYGMSFNFDLVGGENRHYNKAQLGAVQRLLDASDFVGISAYNEVKADDLHPADFLGSLHEFRSELSHDYLLELPAGKQIEYSETGLGGGTIDNNGSTVARTPAQAAEAPYSGIFGRYFANHDPWQDAALRAFRVLFFRQLLDFLAMPLESFGENYNLHAAYLWNLNSWDVQGLRDDSAAYRDQDVVEMMRTAALRPPAF